jgi:beta-barrel assembly-enhancing protease
MPTIHRRHSAFAVVALTVILVGACASSGVNRGQFNIISLEEEWRLGQQLERDIARQLPLVEDRAALAYVNAVGQRIVRQTELAQLPWRFHIVAGKDVNAFNIPGGHVYVNSGLISTAGDVSEFAAVLAHEISHGVSRHGTEQLSRAYGINALGSVLLGQNPKMYEQILAQVLAQGSMARFSRSAENEADRLGVRYMYEAGYDPNGMVKMFRRLLEQRRRQPSSVERFFSTHPLTEDRITSVQRDISALPQRAGLTSRDPEYQQLQSRVSRYGR